MALPPPCTNPPSTSAEDSQLVSAFVLSALFSHTILVLPPWRCFLLLSLNHCLICCSSHLKTSCKALHIETTSSGNPLQAQKVHGVQGCHNACKLEQGVSVFYIYNFERSNTNPERTWGVLHLYFSQDSLQSISIFFESSKPKNLHRQTCNFLNSHPSTLKVYTQLSETHSKTKAKAQL